MNVPQNYRKINGYQCDPIRFEIGRENNNELWVFSDNTSLMNEYCTLMTIDWKKREFHLRKCVLGRGYDGEDITGIHYFNNTICKTMDSFAKYILSVVEKLSKMGVYNN
jgi:hypothetical protein